MHLATPPQRAMKLSREQKRVLAEERLRRLADSARLAAERAPLLQLLSPQLLRDDGTNMERIFNVRTEQRQADTAKERGSCCLICVLIACTAPVTFTQRYDA